MQCAWFPNAKGIYADPILHNNTEIACHIFYNLQSQIQSQVITEGDYTARNAQFYLEWTRDLWVSIMLLSLCLGEFQMTFNFLAS